jgi:hypothetical protein
MSIAASPLVWASRGTPRTYTLLTALSTRSWGKVGSPRQFFSPAGPPVRYGVVKKAVRPWGEPSIVIYTPPILKRLL